MHQLRAKVRTYYSGKIKHHGPTPLGVDWPNAVSQYLRFAQLVKVCDFTRPFSLNDFGCGYGALLEYIALRHPRSKVTYHGVDISPSMVETARERWKKNRRATFAVGSRCGQIADYSLASGIFNVRLGQPVGEWESYVESILADLRGNSRIGFSVNFMLPHDAQPSENELYRTQPKRWMTFCQRALGGSVQSLGGYGLREFTLLVRCKPQARPARGRVRPHTLSRRSLQ